MVLFTGTSDPAEGGRWHVGLLDDLSCLALPQPLGRKVLEAWSYGPRRTVPAADVAGVFAYLLAVDEDPNLLRRDKQVSRLREALQAKAFAPRDVVADGLIGVQWWDNTGQDRALVLHTLWVDANHASTHLRHSFEEAPLPTEPVPTTDGVPPGCVDAEGAG